MKKFTLYLVLIISLFFSTACTPIYTETIKINKDNVLLIAHRGLSGLAVENTKEAFILAGEHSYYGIESDVRRTKDGNFVMVHDDNLERISGNKIEVENATINELIKIPLFKKNENKLGSDKIATLSDYISICKQYEKQAILELKSYFSNEEISRIIEIINGFNYAEKVTFISFHYDNLLMVRSLLPNSECHYLFSKITDRIKANLLKDKIYPSISKKILTKKIVDFFHNANLKVACWTVDSKKVAEKYVSWGVDYITTNILE